MMPNRPALYFSYGSNMSSRRLRARVPSASRVGTGILRQHELRFHKLSSVDGSAKCDAMRTERSGSKVYGVLYRIAAEDRATLDRIEGLGLGYEHETVTIEVDDGGEQQAFCYFATAIDPCLKPFDWYREHVLHGARENALPEAYVRAIEAVATVMDGDLDRRRRELSIYS
jgi:gamma-glutamylcyclotransferase (GGCT)/AIG2-like uncharacterized protein YtfP